MNKCRAISAPVYRILVVLLLTCFYVNPLFAQSCPTVTWTPSIKVTSGPAPCNSGALWNGWNCVTLESSANNNGATYQLEARWNLVDQTVRGSWTWLVGGPSSTFFRESQNLANQAQNQLANQDQIRSIDTKFTNGRGQSPQNGDVNISVIYTDLIRWLVDNNIMQGVKGHFGSSAGSVQAAMGIAHHGLDTILDGAVFGAGPTHIILDTVCAPGGAPLDIRQRADNRTWVDLTGQRPCEMMQPGLANPSFDCMSLLGSEANKNYPSTMVAVLLGATDPDLSFIEPEARKYVSLLSVEQSSVDVIPSTPHNVLKTNAGLNKVLQRIREIVDAGNPQYGDTMPPAPPYSLQLQ